MKNILCLQIQEISQVAEARRLASSAAIGLGFNDTDVGRIAIIVTELAGNLIKHTTYGGEIVMQTYKMGDSEGVEFIVMDIAPGMRNVAECLRDGYSTAGSPGTGLGSVTRLSDMFDVYSVYGLGTVIVSRISLNKAGPVRKAGEFDTGGIYLPKPGQDVSGDNWRMKSTPKGIMVMVADGLGHGTEAAVASMEAVKGFQQMPYYSLNETMELLHGRLRHTRGAAISLVEIDKKEKNLSFCGIGNVAGIIYSEGNLKSMISHNGIVGHETRKIHTFNYPWSEESTVILHSDGIATRWSLDKYPGLPLRSSTVISSVLYRDYKRGNDDATVIVIKQ